MPHERSRHVLTLLLKRQRLWPILGVLGARQTGKSTLFRTQVAPAVSAKYVTLDQKDLREQANRHPSLFLENFHANPVIIDEVQKAPDLFDALKQSVDENKRPGKFLLTGSTDFSRKVGIRESLTGRIGLIRLYPLTLGECLQKKFTAPWLTQKNDGLSNLNEIGKRLKHGGLPGICFLRSEEERRSAFDAWLDTTCFRDLQQIKTAKLSGDLAKDLLTQMCLSEDPTIAAFAKNLRMDARKIKTHLEALETLFVVQRVEPHALGIGKARYYLFDSGLAAHLGANKIRQSQIWLMHECLAQHEYSGVPIRLKYYTSRKGSQLDILLEKKGEIQAYKITDEESVSSYTLRAATSFLKHAPKSQVTILAPCKTQLRIHKQIVVKPFGAMG